MLSIIITNVLIFDNARTQVIDVHASFLYLELRSVYRNERERMPRLKPSAPQWQPGQSGNPKGRPIGSRNKLNEKFILALHDDFAKHGPAVIEKVRETRPEIYLKVIASILPRELHFRTANAFDGISDEELNQSLESIRRVLASRAPIGDAKGGPAPGGSSKLN